MAMLNVVLVEPEIPQNAGNIARTCAATGARLHMIRPLGFTPDDKHMKRAGLDYWNYLDLTYYDGLNDFFNRNSGPCFYFTTKAQNLYSDMVYPDNCYLFFGKETAGLPEQLLFSNKNRCVRLPMLPGLRSLNLSNTVAVGVYEVLRQWNFPSLQNYGSLTQFNWESLDHYT